MSDVPERKSYRLAYITLAVCAAILLAVAVVAVVSYKGTDASQEVRESTRRADCKTVVNSYRNSVLDARDALVFDGLVASASRDEAEVARVRALAPKMRDALHDTPTAAEIIEHGWRVPASVRAVAPELPAYIAPCPT